MKSLTLARFDPDPPENPDCWHVGFDAVFDNGQRRHSVTTVYAGELASPEKDAIVTAARDKIWQGLWLEEQINRGAPPPPDVKIPESQEERSS
jgi:hypothetical protein